MANNIFDLRDENARTLTEVDLSDAIVLWQEIAAFGRKSGHWKVRNRFEALGAGGSIDSSRKWPGL